MPTESARSDPGGRGRRCLRDGRRAPGHRRPHQLGHDHLHMLAVLFVLELDRPRAAPDCTGRGGVVRCSAGTPAPFLRLRDGGAPLSRVCTAPDALPLLDLPT